MALGRAGGVGGTSAQPRHSIVPDMPDSMHQSGARWSQEDSIRVAVAARDQAPAGRRALVAAREAGARARAVRRRREILDRAVGLQPRLLQVGVANVRRAVWMDRGVDLLRDAVQRGRELAAAEGKIKAVRAELVDELHQARAGWLAGGAVTSGADDGHNDLRRVELDRLDGRRRSPWPASAPLAARRRHPGR